MQFGRLCKSFSDSGLIAQMKLSETFEAVGYKRLVAVDLPGLTSHQHELSGVSALKSLFGTTENELQTVRWVHFPNGGDPEYSDDTVKFYDARAKSATRTGRSEWRVYYRGNFLARARVGDLLVIVRTHDAHRTCMILPRESAAYTEAISLFGLDITNSFASLAAVALETREWNALETPILAKWFDIPPETVPTAKPIRQELDFEQPIAETSPASLNHTDLRTGEFAFKPRARMLILLGDQLIRDAGMAVFELVKNAYDADATQVDVTLSHVTDRDKGVVIVEDNGCGMSWEQIVNVWLEPGTDYRRQQKLTGYRTPRFHRLPLGEKGVGRFAAHKLGSAITLISRQEKTLEVVVKVNWGDFQTAKYLSNALVSVSEQEPRHFTAETTGTRIEIAGLNEELSRGTIRQIHRAVNSISSPFRSPTDFNAQLDVIPAEASLSGLLDVDKVLDLAPYRATCLLEKDLLTYDYEFTPPSGLQRIDGRAVQNTRINIPSFDLFSTTTLAERVGALLIEIRIWDLDPQILQYSITDKKGFKDFLRLNGGVRVYRDGMRVYDYGEPGNDWLDLGGRRVNEPTGRVSNNQIIAAVHLDGQASGGLIEKTNREGFIEDATFQTFREAVLFALTQVMFERNKDKQRLRLVYSERHVKQPVLTELAELRRALKQLPGNGDDLLPIVDQVETQFVEMRDTLITAAGAGLTLTIVIHEVEKAIHILSLAIERQVSQSELRELATHLNELVEGLTYLTRKSGRNKESFSLLIAQAIVNTRHRTKAHNIHVIDGVALGNPDISVTCTRRLVIATLMNLIDNSIFWLGLKHDDDRRIFIGSSTEIPGGPVLFVADNGPGFQDAPENLVQPFMSRRPDGMGLGLHIADLIMKSHEGTLIFPTHLELGISDAYSGAIVGLQFKQP